MLITRRGAVSQALFDLRPVCGLAISSYCPWRVRQCNYETHQRPPLSQHGVYATQRFKDRPTFDRASATFATSTPCLSGRVHGGKKNAPDDSGAITFSGTFSGILVGARSGAGAGAGVWAGFGTVSGMSIGVEPG
jgi:hypothetical protein